MIINSVKIGFREINIGSMHTFYFCPNVYALAVLLYVASTPLL